MRVTAGDLVAWSFLMSTAHAAGLMLVPLPIGGLAHGPISSAAARRNPHGAHGASAIDAAYASEGGAALAGAGSHLGPLDPSIANGAVAVAVHSRAMLLVMALVAIAVFDKLGLAVLRRAWINLDLVWTVALLVAGVATLLA